MLAILTALNAVFSHATPVRCTNEDLIIGNAAPTAKIEECSSFSNSFFDLVQKLHQANSELGHQSPFYLFECPACIKDHLPLCDLSCSYCVLDKLCVCNWPIVPLKERLQNPISDNERDATSSQFNDRVFTATNSIFASLRTALCVGLNNTMWRDSLHPKFWPFLSMGPTGEGGSSTFF